MLKITVTFLGGHGGRRRFEDELEKEETNDMLDVDPGRSKRALMPSIYCRSFVSLAKPRKANFLCW